jgi:hypothetical protein
MRLRREKKVEGMSGKNKEKEKNRYSVVALILGKQALEVGGWIGERGNASDLQDSSRDSTYVRTYIQYRECSMCMGKHS